MSDRMSKHLPDWMPDRMSEYFSDMIECQNIYQIECQIEWLQHLCEYMSERMPEARVVSNRLSADSSKQSHAISVKFKCEGSKYAVLG